MKADTNQLVYVVSMEMELPVIQPMIQPLQEVNVSDENSKFWQFNCCLTSNNKQQNQQQQNRNF